MGRNLKRVAMDFDWPINKTWKGYVNPHYRKCPDCESGSTASAAALNHLVHLILIAGENSLIGKVHPWLQSAGIADVGTTMHELTAGLAGRQCSLPFGHDCGDRWTAHKKIVAAAGLTKDWGTCKTCDGECVDPAVRADYEAWKEFDPPVGDGFQLWESTSEGSPISPVFASLPALCEWASVHATTFGCHKASADEWLKMLDAGFVSHREGNAIFI